MATIVFSAIGTLIGGPIGGAIGALVGRQVDGAIIGSPNREGPRLKELAATSSSYGAVLPRHFGRMRVAGSIIWATDLVEHRDRQGGGKGKPSVTTYSYTASFAVALASRRIVDIGRIWADGNLLRGAEGDLKTAGTMRIYSGDPDQPADPFMQQDKGVDRCPAYRGLAYVVFEDLDLGDFFNRIPALTFEVIADEADISLDQIVGEVVDDVDARVVLAGIGGMTCEGPVVDTLHLLSPLFPIDCDVAGEKLVIGRERLQGGAIALGEPAAASEDADFGKVTGFTRKRLPPPANPPQVLRYYDIERDYQPGMQRATGRPARGQPQTVELPAAIRAQDARSFAERSARRSDWAREKLAWRTTELDPQVGPGSVVTVPGQSGHWRVTDWEWREAGIELSLDRVIPTGADTVPGGAVDPGQGNPPVDMPLPATALSAFELPWDGSGSGDAAAPFAAVSSAGSNWAGAALFVDRGDGDLIGLGPSGRTRAILGAALSALPVANPLLFDRSGHVDVQLADPAMILADASGRQLMLGANRALLGPELFQFALAAPLGDGNWRLSGLLRGRGGTEGAVAGHAIGESFVLLDGAPLALDPALVGDGAATEIVALGRGDETPVASPIALRGITLRPLSPVHARVRTTGDGSMALQWTRRARGAWAWLDGVDVPLVEQAESYQVTFGPIAAPLAVWLPTVPELVLSPAQIASLAAMAPEGALHVRQRGSFALSEPLYLTTL